ncbi:MAG: DUF4395 domain-containing protein [Deltaproteobacteria bacterium]
MSTIGKFGEEVEGYRIPVLNEREIRAAAGILFALMFSAIAAAALKGSFVLLKYAIAIFLPDMLIRVLLSPRYSPTLILGRLIVRNQVPEYVGARQKKFAWIIGVALASVMFVLVNVLNTYSPISGIICLLCLVFLFCETAFGICIGCKLYALVSRQEPEYCPGEVCEVRDRQAIQRVSPAQLAVVLGLVAYVVLVVVLFQAGYRVPPHALFGG